MKRIILFFAVCLGLSVSQTTFADDSETVRAATKRSTNTNISSNANRSISYDAKRADTGTAKNSRTATKTTQTRTSTRTPVNSSVKSRTPIQTTKNITQRVATTKKTLQSRNINTRKTNSLQNDITHSEKTKSATRAATKPLNIEKMQDIKAADYSRCKTVYYECMDEFCANKDANLRRCACSSRVHEFDNIQKQLDAAEDKMLEFNQRLLTVSLDKEDAAAINVATEGENAFNIKDKTQSEKLLQKITKTLNSSDNSKITNDLSSVSLSLDMDSAWDDIDSLGGIATTSKNGLDLYNAANPVCLEMAKEICTDDELKIAQDGYKITIQQDCNTVAKSYDTLHTKAIEKIHESGALLDMSRLESYQQRNSDDTLTCKKKILDQLSETSVCGENLYKCLDMTGEYVDPSTGKAFLSENLYNLSTLLKEPTGDEKWSKITQNEPFVNFLKSKKKFLEPAIEQCQDIADTIWKEFLDDALSQIKLAQKAKMEEVRQSCTKLVAECKTNALTDLSEFDVRALSTFSVTADKTANEMCSRIQNSCIALMSVDDANASWSYGISGIATDITYDTIIDTCAQIGRDCIIQKCNGTSGNFSLCTSATSDNRMDILQRNACWDKVLECVQSADNLANMESLPIVKNRQNYYASLYSDYNNENKEILCLDENGVILTDPALSNCKYNQIPKFCDENILSGVDLTACLIAEQIWGNCETNNDSLLITTEQSLANTLNDYATNTIYAIKSNQILMPKNGSTLLSWFATNTNTAVTRDSCNTYDCPINYQHVNGTCQLLYQSDETTDCAAPTRRSQIINVTPTITNFCPTNVRDSFGNCCDSGFKNNGICVPSSDRNALYFMTTTCDSNACDGLTANTTPTLSQCQTDISYYCPNDAPSRQIYVYCITTNDSIDYDGTTYSCGNNGIWLLIDQYGNYFDVTTTGQSAPTMTYKQNCDCNSAPITCTTCTYSYSNAWSFGSSCTDINTSVPTNNEFMITY